MSDFSGNIKNTLEGLKNNLDRTIDRLFNEPQHAEAKHEEQFWTPSTILATGGPMVDMEEDDNEIRVTAELPGMEREDFTVELSGTRLILRGEKKCVKEEKGKNSYYSECCYGSFNRVLALPCEVEQSKVEAKFKNGVLKLRLPKSESAKGHKINVDIG